MSAKRNLKNKRFGRLVALCEGPKTKSGQTRWLCRCDCGKESYVVGASLLDGHTRSCGCIREEFLGKSFAEKIAMKGKGLTG